MLNSKIDNHGNVLFTEGTKASVYKDYVTLCTLNLPVGAPFIVFGFVTSSISDTTSVISAQLGRTVRTSMHSGGGCVVYNYYPDGGAVSLLSYGYLNSKYNLIGNLTAIRLK